MNTSSILLLVALAILMTGVLAALIYIYRQRRLTQALLRAEQARRQAQEETRATLYSIGDGVIATDAAGCVTRMNPVAERLTGRREAAALGQPLEQVFHIINEDTRVEVENPVARVLREGVVVGLANHSLLIARGGTERPIADSGAPIRNEKDEIVGVVLVFRDQTEERAAQRALRESEERYRMVAYYTYDWEYWQSPDGKLVYVSPSCERITGYRAEEFMQAPGLLATIVHPDDRHVLEPHKHILAQDGDAPEAHQGDFRIFRRDGETRWIGHACQIVRRLDGTFSGIRASNREITERKQAEAQLIEQLEELRRWHTATLGRETRILDLKAEVNILLAQVGQPPRYASAEQASHE